MSSRIPAAIVSLLLILLPSAFPQTIELTSVKEIRGYDFPTVTNPPLARVSGVVTYERQTNGFYLQDAAGEGIFVQPAANELPPASGTWVEVRGQISPGRLIPYVGTAHILTRLSAATRPTARPSSFDQLMTGLDDAQFVELRGVIRTVTIETNRFRLIIGSGRGRILAEFPRTAGPMPLPKLEDASVRLIGVCENTYDSQDQLRGVRILLGDWSQLTIEQSAQPVAELPVRPACSILRYSVCDDPKHRVRLRGTVSLCDPGKRVYLQDETGGVMLRTLDPIDLKPGDEVEALAYPTLGSWIPFLQDATFTLLHSGKPPEPLLVTAADVLATNHYAELVSIQAQLINHIARAGEWTLFLREGNTVFTASLDQQAVSPFDCPDGSLVQLSGVCTVSVDPMGHLRNLQLILRSGNDIRILRLPGWWTLDRALAAVGALLLAALVAWVWVTTLRQRVRRQSEIIRQRFERQDALQKKFRDLFENASDPVFTTDLNGRLLSLNRAAREVIGNPTSEPNTTLLADCALPTQRQRVEAWLAEAGKSDSPGCLEVEFRRPDGRPATFDISPRRIHHEGHAAALQCIARDISARKQSETALAEAHGLLANTHAELQRINEQLERIHHSLEREIGDRQRAQSELDRLHRQLLATAREAGMVEVSTGVLHNTANVLNSINVSAERIAESLRTSHMDGVARVSALLGEHESNLADYLTNDEKGRHVGMYITQLAGQLANERNSLLDDIGSLRKDVDHISTIIATQQNYATVAGLLERVDAGELIRDAVKITDSLLVRHKVTVQYEIAELGLLTTDRHQVMQVLVNLLRNAAFACAESGHPKPAIVIRLKPAPGRRFQLEVEDNGIGIPASNLTRIFHQGFSTRQGGHGFGLHSCALAAQGLGGTLTVHSEGTNRGARFTLDLPVDAISPKEEHD